MTSTFLAEVVTPTDIPRPDTLEINVWRLDADGIRVECMLSIDTDLPTKPHATADPDETMDDALKLLAAEGWEMAEGAEWAYQGLGYSFLVRRTATASSAARIRAAQQAAIHAQAAFEQAIRDEIHAERITPSDAARALGTKNRQRVYAILGRGPDGSDPVPPALTPVVYLRGRGRPEAVWERVRAAMWARGWYTTSDRTTAWHLARGGVPTVMLDFSTELDDHPPAPGGGTWYGYDLYVIIGQVRARHGDDGPELQRINGGRHDVGMKVDEHVLAGWVAEALAS